MARRAGENDPKGLAQILTNGVMLSVFIFFRLNAGYFMVCTHLIWH